MHLIIATAAELKEIPGVTITRDKDRYRVLWSDGGRLPYPRHKTSSG
jgi:hypothetical protein